ncbi:filamentous hemagglutinin N-terminal domain-containing protein [Cupriavidus sp. H18C2]|uniref:two-partner secretion domain-containing protein n=1 Tax=Cupriavidus sp. H18C2 TaxID=3241602 RepID=UPI003BF7AB65
MNKNRYRRVFSKHLGMLVAVAENVKSRGKAPGEGAAAEASPQLGVVSAMTAIALALFAWDMDEARAQGLPTQGNVVAGQATISQPNGSTMTINQGSQRAVIDWNSFSIGQGNTVQFNQPNAQAQALNRVTGGLPSNIHGSLLANGQVLIQNANGVLFGRGAVVNVGSLLATTKSIDSNAFMAGSPLALSATGTQAGIINEGSINAQGYVTFMGDQVRNAGDIKTGPGGQVLLAAGDSATVALHNGQGISLVLNDATANALAENSGNIHAQDGTVLITARGKDTLLNTVVNLSGVVRAGTVVADAGKTGDVVMTGSIDASNRNGGQGGTVVLAGDRVGLFDSASIDASGDSAGGKVILGGDSLGKLEGTEARKLLQDGAGFANFTQVGVNARVDAGARHGDGGFVETSAHDLNVFGTVTAAAPNGKSGDWLIDPTDIIITTWDSGYTGSVSDGFTAGTTGAKVSNTSINNALNNGTDVMISTASSGPAAGNITQQANITKTSGAAANLTMIAQGNVSLTRITTTGEAINLTIRAGEGTGKGRVTSTTDTVLDLGGGYLDIAATSELRGTHGAVELYGRTSNIGGATIVGHGNLGMGVILSNFTVLGDGHLEVIGTSKGYYHGVMFSGTVNIGGNGTANISGTSTDNSGVYLGGQLNVSGNRTVNFNGKSRDSYGVYMQSPGLTASENGTININGRSENGTGIYISGSQVERDNGEINFNSQDRAGPEPVVPPDDGNGSNGGNGTDGNGSNGGNGPDGNGDGPDGNGNGPDGNGNGPDGNGNGPDGNGNGPDGNGNGPDGNGNGPDGNGNGPDGNGNGPDGNGNGPDGNGNGPDGNGNGPDGNGNGPDGNGNGPDGNGNGPDGNGSDGGNGSNGGNGSDGGDKTPDGGSDGSGGSGSGGSNSGATAGAIMGAVGAGGILAYVIDDLTDETWYLDAPVPLTVESDEDKAWEGALMSGATVRVKGTTATVQVKTRSGTVERTLTLQDGANGTKHFVFEDPVTKTKADLAVNMETREFFYTEAGAPNGKRYVVKSHGWLKDGSAPESAAAAR